MRPRVNNNTQMKSENNDVGRERKSERASPASAM